MHGLHVPSATRKQALLRQIYGHRQPGPGGKASLPLVVSRLRRKEAKERKICLLHCWKNNLLQSICRRQHLLPCFFFFFFLLASVACLNEKWEYLNQVLVTEDHVLWSHQTFWCSRGQGSKPRGIRSEILVSPFNLSCRDWIEQLCWLAYNRILENYKWHGRGSVLACIHQRVSFSCVVPFSVETVEFQDSGMLGDGYIIKTGPHKTVGY